MNIVDIFTLIFIQKKSKLTKIQIGMKKKCNILDPDRKIAPVDSADSYCLFV